MITLAQSRTWRFINLAVLYSAQGVPNGLFTVAVPSWMATQDYATAAIASFIGIVTLPWSLKLLAAPLMDRFTFLDMGFRRPWILAAQFSLILTFLQFGWIPEDLIWMSSLGALANTFAATQDVAVDGMAIDILPEKDRATANAFMFGGQYLGRGIGASGGGYALTYLGLAEAGFFAAAYMLIVLSFPLMFLERPGEKRLPWSHGRATQRALKKLNSLALIKKTGSMLILPASVLLILNQFTGAAAIGICVALLPVYTVKELAIANTDFNDFNAIGALIGAVFGVLIAPFFDRISAYRAHWYTSAFLVVVVAALPLTVSDYPLASIVALTVASQLTVITVIATMMKFCHPTVAATQFAIYMALGNLSTSIGTFTYAGISHWVDYSDSLWLAATLATSGFIFWAVLGRYLDSAPDTSLTHESAHPGPRQSR